MICLCLDILIQINFNGNFTITFPVSKFLLGAEHASL